MYEKKCLTFPLSSASITTQKPKYLCYKATNPTIAHLFPRRFTIAENKI